MTRDEAAKILGPDYLLHSPEIIAAWEKWHAACQLAKAELEASVIEAIPDQTLRDVWFEKLRAHICEGALD